jgi:hypothetical protein
VGYVVGDGGNGWIDGLEVVMMAELQIELGLACMVGVCARSEGLGFEGGCVLMEVW